MNRNVNLNKEKKEKKIYSREEQLKKFGYVFYSSLTVDERKKIDTLECSVIDVKEYGQKRCYLEVVEGLGLRIELTAVETTLVDKMYPDGIIPAKLRIFECISKRGNIYYNYEIVYLEIDGQYLMTYGTFTTAQGMLDIIEIS